MDIKIILKFHLQQKQENTLGFSMSTMPSFKSIENNHDVYRGKDCM